MVYHFPFRVFSLGNPSLNVATHYFILRNSCLVDYRKKFVSVSCDDSGDILMVYFKGKDCPI